MITGLDHIVLLCPDIEAGITDYTTLLGRAPDWRASGDGAATAVFAMDETALELMAPEGAGETADRLRALTVNGARLTTLVYRSDDLLSDHARLAAAGLQPGEITAGSSVDAKTGAQRSWQRLRLPDAQMHGIKTFLLAPHGPGLQPGTTGPEMITRLDTLTLMTGAPERTQSLYEGQIGLRLALSRTFDKTSIQFFKAGRITLEMVHRGAQAGDEDRIWGLVWGARDLDAVHARLSAAGLTLNEIRGGMKPGTRVFTAKSGTQGIPTLFIAASKG
ncbi:MAG: VOC family protein [Pseudomonadota bacterium]